MTGTTSTETGPLAATRNDSAASTRPARERRAETRFDTGLVLFVAMLVSLAATIVLTFVLAAQMC